jgi:hypothetical protein
VVVVNNDGQHGDVAGGTGPRTAGGALAGGCLERGTQVIRCLLAIPKADGATCRWTLALAPMGVREVTEDTPPAHADHLCLGYPETRFTAEEMPTNAGRAGLPVAIYRPMDVAGVIVRASGMPPPKMCAVIRFITDTGLAPDIGLATRFRARRYLRGGHPVYLLACPVIRARLSSASPAQHAAGVTG